jgi:hypothetical protein
MEASGWPVDLIAGPAACTGCHGNAAGNYWPDSVSTVGGGNGTVYPNRLGAHATHVTAIAVTRFGGSTVALKNQTCDTCHPNPGASGHDANVAPLGIADVHRDAQNAGTHFLNIKGAPNGVLTESYNNATTANGGSCSAVDCHYRVTTPVTGVVNDGWYNVAAASTC